MTEVKEDLYAELKNALESDEEIKEPEKAPEAPLEEEKVAEVPSEAAAPEPEVVIPEPEAAPEPEEIKPAFKNVKDFLSAVQDEPSRELLGKFYEVVKGEINTTLAPIEQKNNEAKFNAIFAQYEKIDGLAAHKNDLLKTFLRNPNQSPKALIGERALDLQTAKIKPIEKTPSTPNRGKIDINSLSKDELYDTLESFRNN